FFFVSPNPSLSYSSISPRTEKKAINAASWMRPSVSVSYSYLGATNCTNLVFLMHLEFGPSSLAALRSCRYVLKKIRLARQTDRCRRLYGCHAAELLKHPHLQPYVLEVNLKSPTWNILPIMQAKNNHLKKITFSDASNDSMCNDEEKRRSFSSEKILKLNKPVAEHDSFDSTQTIKVYPNYPNQRIKGHVGDIDVYKANSEKHSPTVKTPRYTPKSFTTPRKVVEPSKSSHTGWDHELLPSRTTPDKSGQHTGRTSPPSLKSETPYRHKVGIINPMESPDISVNSPRIDRIAEFPLASFKDSLFTSQKLPSDHGSSLIPHCGDCSITKDKCTVQIFRTKGENRNYPSDGNPVAADVSIRGSSESMQRRFDTSSYEQRAEALEGLLEFSAQLLQQERFEELGILLKPFGPEKVSPRETAIWLTKSFKETAVC
ncbi:hypothetical protein BHE74_00041314, partial [Ensete ventricosum]